jgi:hypothetical protein
VKCEVYICQALAELILFVVWRLQLTKSFARAFKLWFSLSVCLLELHHLLLEQGLHIIFCKHFFFRQLWQRRALQRRDNQNQNKKSFFLSNKMLLTKHNSKAYMLELLNQYPTNLPTKDISLWRMDTRSLLRLPSNCLASPTLQIEKLHQIYQAWTTIPATRRSLTSSTRSAGCKWHQNLNYGWGSPVSCITRRHRCCSSGSMMQSGWTPWRLRW